MNEPKHDISRMSFQVERFITFTDGVFAIVITIMVFEIKVPELTHLNDQELWNDLSKMGLKFFGFLISFGIVGHYWAVHHRIFGYAVRYSTSLLWINFAFLFTVAILPFSSALLGEYGSYTNMRLPYAVYVLNICLTGMMNYWMWVYISNPKRDMLTRKIPRSRIRLGEYRSLVIPIIFFISFLVSLVLPVISRLIPLLIPVILLRGMGALEKKADLDEIPNALIGKELPVIPEEDTKE
ncbi:MAG: TMEM175 family protein [Bacteroidota bacterium]|nr:TMEM175 family protein [Bacteroidota bacterium]